MNFFDTLKNSLLSLSELLNVTTSSAYNSNLDSAMKTMR